MAITPEGLTNSEFKEFLQTQLSKSVLDVTLSADEIIVNVKRDAIKDVLNFLKTDGKSRFEQLIGITAADYPQDVERFEVVYLLSSLKFNRRLIVKIRTDEATPVETATTVYNSAGWYEREVWDMFGVKFAGHQDLRRILTDYGFEGHPLRKDFPLTGYYEVRYDESQKKVVYEDVNLNQEFRNFDYLSPWEGAKYTFENELKGDEKAS